MLRTIGWLACLAGAGALFSQTRSPSLGLFDGNSDVGTVLHKGAVKFDPASLTYTVTGSGQNIWAAEDDFQFVWKKVSAENVTLGASVQILGAGGDHHRKGVLMIRQSLEPDAAYVDVAVHGDGLTSLQFRDSKGAATHEIESSVSGPKRLKIEKRRDRFSMWIGSDEGELRFSGAATTVAVTSPFYVGIGVSAHDKDAVESVAFSNVGVSNNNAAVSEPSKRYSALLTMSVRSTDARVTYVTSESIESPEWSDDQTLSYSIAGKTERIPASLYGSPSIKPAESQQRDGGVSPDGTQAILLSSVVTGEPAGKEAVLSVVTLADRTTKVLAKLRDGAIGARPWSPDGKRIVYVSYDTVP